MTSIYALARADFFKAELETAELYVNGQKQTVTVEMREDRLLGIQSIISPERAGRPLSFYPEMTITQYEDCPFDDPFNNMPEPLYRHTRDGEVVAVTSYNLHPSGQHHYVSVYAPFGIHKSAIPEVDYSDLDAWIESEYDLVKKYNGKAEAFQDYTNFGALAGASQKHFHSQRKATKLDPAHKDLTRNAKELYDRYGKNPFDIYVEQELEDGQRVIYCDDNVYIGAMFAPRTTDGIIVIPRQDMSNILRSDRSYRSHVAHSFLGAFRGLHFINGYKDVNIGVYQAPYEVMDEPWFRLHILLLPRRLRQPPVDQAGEEIFYRRFPVENIPEETAAKHRPWYKGASPEFLLKVNGQVPPEIWNEFVMSELGSKPATQ